MAWSRQPKWLLFCPTSLTGALPAPWKEIDLTFGLLRQNLNSCLGPLSNSFNHLSTICSVIKRLTATLQRSHCFGNLLLAAAVYREIDQSISNVDLATNQKMLHRALFSGLCTMAQAIGAGERAVLPCTSTPAQLRVLYTNGVEVTGEHKLSEARRGFPVESS